MFVDPSRQRRSVRVRLGPLGAIRLRLGAGWSNAAVRQQPAPRAWAQPPHVSSTVASPVLRSEALATPGEGPIERLLGLFRTSTRHTASSATLLLAFSSIASGGLGLVRSKYIASVFGATNITDAYNYAFILPGMISYFLVGGVASITLVSMLNKFREAGDEEGADRALSVVLLAMLAVLGTGIALAEIFAPVYTRYAFPKLDSATSALCTHLTRILLPAQLFFFAGGVLGSRLLVRKIFLYQAFTPILYNLGIILGGVFLASRLGIDSLAWGVLAGSFVGALAMNWVGAMRSGLNFYWIFNLRHPAFVEWLKLSLPLIVGVSLAMADTWILGYFTSADRGGYTRLTNAKMLFNAPLSIIGFTAGAASLPFFSSLFAQGRLYDFNTAVSRSVSRLIAASLLLTAWMIALAEPIVDLYRGGKFSHQDVILTEHYFAIFALSLAFWSSQGIYARAFYAARNTLTPAISGTVVTLVSVPIYWQMSLHFGVDGLAVASDLGIVMHTLALALLLHRARLVSMATLEFGELARAGLAACVALGGTWWLLQQAPPHHGHLAGVLVLLLGTVIWAGLGVGVLRLTGSKLLGQLLRR